MSSLPGTSMRTPQCRKAPRSVQAQENDKAFNSVAYGRARSDTVSQRRIFETVRVLCNPK